MIERKYVRDLMAENVQTVSHQETVYLVAKMMGKHNIGAVVVTGASQEPVGIFTERDLLKRVVALDVDMKTTLISKVMTPKFVCVQTMDELDGVADLMLQGNFRHVPVVDNERLVGMLSIRDILRYLAKSG